MVDAPHRHERAVTPFTVILALAWGALAAAPVLVVATRRRAHDRVRILRTTRPRPVGARAVATLRARRGATVIAPWRWWSTRRTRRARARAIERSLPLALDVLTVASRAGYTTRLALRATARWSPEQLREVLMSVERQCQLGAGLASALDDLAAREPALAPAASALAVTERSGAPTAELLARLAGEARAGFRRRAEAHARRVPVRLLFPLVFLVLPAFGLLTVVPALLLGLRNS